MKRTRFPSSRRSSASWRSAEDNGNIRRTYGTKIRDISEEFLQSTSIHGMRYIGERNRPSFERAIWTLIVSVGCIFSIYGCYLEWNKWNDSVILVTRDMTVVTHDPLVFPMVTVCSTNKISKKKLDTFIRDPKYDGLNFTTITKVIGYLTRFNSLLEPDNEFSQTQDYLTKKNVTMEDLIHIVQHVTPSCQDILLDCKWQANVVDCHQLVSSRLTDNGVCCSIEVDSLSLSEKFLDANPSIVEEFGVNSALRIILDTNPNDTAVNATPYDGFRVLLHNRKEFPDVTNRGFPVASGHENFVAVNSYSVRYTSGIPKVPFEKRQCHIEGERKLKYHPSYKYTRSICLHECRLERIIEECRCIPYFYEASNVFVPNCSLEAYTCVARYFSGYYQSLISSYCNCPEICNTNWFTAELSSVPFSPTGFPRTKSSMRISNNKDIDPNASQRFVGLRIFFKHNAGDSFTMDLPFDTKELFASMGGLLGFGLGFSIISGVELLYFLCCRWCFRQKRDLSRVSVDHVWTGNDFELPHGKSRQLRTIRANSPVRGSTVAWIN